MTSPFRVSVVTLFPEAFESFLQTSLLGKAQKAGSVVVDFVNPRDFTEDKHRTVDDMPYGGGPGMLLKPEPLARAIESVSDAESLRILLAPSAKPLTQKKVQELAEESHLVLICGRYEGVDERVVDRMVDERLSIGDYVLSGGEVAAMTVIEAVTRMLPGVLGAAESKEQDSFSNGLLEFPQYTRPQEFRGECVPDVLLGGNHKEIANWRRDESLRRTARWRPELLRDELGDDNPLRKLAGRTTVVLAHHPVRDKKGDIVTTSVTNLDLHDIARTAYSFGLAGYVVVTPISAQREMVESITEKWQGQSDKDGRAQALNPVRTAASIEEVIATVSDEFAKGRASAPDSDQKASEPLIIATTADLERAGESKLISVSEVQSLSQSHTGPIVLLLGTGWGLSDRVINEANHVLRPILGLGPQNHLSVRSAFAIIADRLFGRPG